MAEIKVFDRTQYEVGDVVIRKFKDDGAEPETVCRSEMVTNIDNTQYNIIYFESNPKDFNVAFEFEPYDKEERKRYYEVWDANPIDGKAKVTPKISKKKEKKPLKFKTKK